MVAITFANTPPLGDRTSEKGTCDRQIQQKKHRAIA
jgi:hypothetical protein